MKRLFALLVMPLLLIACTPEGGVDKDATALLRETAIAQIQFLNASGVDPVTLSPEKLAILSSACAIATAVVTVYRTDIPDAPAAVQDTCVVVLRAAQDAPEPEPAPA